MTSMPYSAPAPGSMPSLDVSGTAPVPLTRLVGVELRKSFDTRAGRAYSFTVLGLCALVMLVIALLVTGDFHDLENFLTAMGGTLSFFLPIIPILLVTQEFGQRTGLVTFALEPRRPRVVVAKLVAGLAITLGVMVVALLLSVVGGALSTVRGFDVDWSLGLSQLWSFVLATLIAVFIGFAIAMLVMNTAAAIVIYFVYSLILPTVVGFLSAFIDWFADLAPWIEFNTAQQPLFSGDYRPSVEEWGQILTAGILWLGVPLALGVWRLLRAEMK